MVLSKKHWVSFCMVQYQQSCRAWIGSRCSLLGSHWYQVPKALRSLVLLVEELCHSTNSIHDGVNGFCMFSLDCITQVLWILCYHWSEPNAYRGSFTGNVTSHQSELWNIVICTCSMCNMIMVSTYHHSTPSFELCGIMHFLRFVPSGSNRHGK